LAIMKGPTTMSTSTTAAAGWVAKRVQEDMQANYWTSLVANCKSCTNYLYLFGSSPGTSHRAAATATATAFGRRVHAVFGLINNNNSSIILNDDGDGGGATAYLHKYCYQQCLSSRPLYNLVLHIISGKLWIPASLVNLAFVKPSLRVLYVNVVFFLWTIILSMILN
jgi:Mpv17 / PMP22 family